MTTDAALLREYADARSEPAFAELVRRHLTLVYRAALRQLDGDPHAAAEATQAVFTLLAQKAAALVRHPSLAGWLYTTTHFAVRRLRRDERRRQIREQEALSMHKLAQDETHAAWAQLRPVLDDALRALGERDRDALLARFFEARSFGEIGRQLALSEDAARMRVERALEKLRALLARRGVTSTSAALGLLLANEAAGAVPAGLAASVAGNAVAGAAALSGTSALAVADLLAMTTTQKILAATALAAALAGGVYQFATLRRQHAQLGQLQSMSATWQRDIQRLERERAAAVARAAVANPPASQAAAAPSDDPALDARLRTLVENVRQLKQRLDASPADRIPELHYLEERDWFSVAQRFPGLATGADPRPAFAALRNAAKANFLRHLDPALKDYLAGSGGQLPAQTAQLAPFFDPPLDDPAILSRYEMLASGPLGARAQSGLLLRERVSLAIDPARDNLAGLNGHGVAMSGVPGGGLEPAETPETIALRTSAERAMRAYEAAHGGDIPDLDQIEKLLPYFERPEDAAKFTTQIRETRARWMPSALNQALNEARRAYNLTHHGADTSDPMELASYFQSPLDGARYLDFIARGPLTR